MVGSAKIEVLTEFLARLPEPMAARLAKAIEVDWLAGGSALPHELILKALRPALQRVHHGDRTLNPLRLFCRPFEDLLSSAPRKEKHKGRIARSSVLPVWNWLGHSLVPSALNKYAIGVKTGVLTFKIEEITRHALEFWPVAANAIDAALDSESKRKAARAILGDAMAVADAQEIACILRAGHEFWSLQEVLPRGAPTLSEDMLWTLREFYDRLIAEIPDAAPYVAVATMNRLAKPWMALKLPLAITRQTQDTLISSTDMGLVGELLFGDLENHAEALRAAKPQAPFDPDDLLVHLAGFTAVSNGIVKEIEMRRDGKWGQRLMKDRSDVAETMESFMERAEREVSAAIPTLKTGAYAGGPRAPDVNRAPDPEKIHRALCFAKLVTGCRPIASAASFGARQKETCDLLTVMLKSYSEDIVKELRAAESDKRANAESYFNIAVELVTILFSVEEGDFLRRRGRAAMGYAVAA
ncbi:MAG: hypothetical protein WBQ17_11855 [Rhizomicrobium sp.]|jgi:hypothetical protein